MILEEKIHQLTKWDLTTHPLSIGGIGCCIQVLGSRDSALRAELCMLPNIVILTRL